MMESASAGNWAKAKKVFFPVYISQPSDMPTARMGRAVVTEQVSMQDGHMPKASSPSSVSTFSISSFVSPEIIGRDFWSKV